LPLNQAPPLPVGSGPTAEEQPPTQCVQCGSPEFSSITELPVCEPCRQALVRYPFPPWVKWSAVGIALLVVFSLWQAPERWSEALHVKQAEKLVQSGQWNNAYEKLLPSKESALRVSDLNFSLEYGEVAAHAGHPEEAMAILDRLEGHEASKQQSERAHQLARALHNQLGGDSAQPR